MLLLNVFAMTAVLSSCKDESGSDKDDLVGTWYYYEDGETDMDTYIVFQKMEHIATLMVNTALMNTIHQSLL